jgi:hypothetical protein
MIGIIRCQLVQIAYLGELLGPRRPQMTSFQLHIGDGPIRAREEDRLENGAIRMALNDRAKVASVHVTGRQIDCENDRCALFQLRPGLLNGYRFLNGPIEPSIEVGLLDAHSHFRGGCGAVKVHFEVWIHFELRAALMFKGEQSNPVARSVGTYSPVGSQASLKGHEPFAAAGTISPIVFSRGPFSIHIFPIGA